MESPAHIDRNTQVHQPAQTQVDRTRLRLGQAGSRTAASEAARAGSSGLVLPVGDLGLQPDANAQADPDATEDKLGPTRVWKPENGPPNAKSEPQPGSETCWSGKKITTAICIKRNHGVFPQPV